MKAQQPAANKLDYKLPSAIDYKMAPNVEKLRKELEQKKKNDYPIPIKASVQNPAPPVADKAPIVPPKKEERKPAVPIQSSAAAIAAVFDKPKPTV